MTRIQRSRSVRLFNISRQTRIATTDGDPDKLAMFDPTPGSGACWLSMEDPLDLRDYR